MLSQVIADSFSGVIVADERGQILQQARKPDASSAWRTATLSERIFARPCLGR